MEQAVWPLSAQPLHPGSQLSRALNLIRKKRSGGGGKREGRRGRMSSKAETRRGKNEADDISRRGQPITGRSGVERGRKAVKKRGAAHCSLRCKMSGARASGGGAWQKCIDRFVPERMSKQWNGWGGV